MADQSNIQSAASKSIRPFKSSEEYLYAMKEDLAEWLNTLYDLDITADTFMESLETGCALCRHANNVNRAAQDFQLEYPEAARAMRMPSRDVVFQSRNAVPGSFLARDNVSNFIGWCRQELGIKDVLMFETNDLVQKRNEKNFVLCLLEVARRGAKFGMLAPMLIQLEEEIEEEIRDQENIGEPSPPVRPISRKESVGVADSPPGLYPSWQQKRVLCDMRNLDELVREILGRCSCPAQFPMTKVSEGKYKVGDSSALIFIRVLRTHVMVRVGGGWDTLEHYLNKHDPCRCSAFAHRHQQSKVGGQGPHSKSSSAHSSRSTSPGPHWRNEGVAPAPYKTPERRALEPGPGPSASPAARLARPHRPSLPVELDANALPGRGHALLPRPPRDRSEPRHFTPLRTRDSLPLARRLSGDSDSSTCSSKGGCGGGGGRASLGGPRRPGGEEVVLLVNRREGKHVIERPKEGGPIPPLRPLQNRARSHSRERPAPSALKPSPPQGAPEGGRTGRLDRCRSLGPEGHRLQAPRSHSQGKLLGRGRAGDGSLGPPPQIREPQPPHKDRGEDPRAKQAAPGGFSKRQSGSPAKGGPSGSPSKKGGASPRPPPPRSPSGGKGRLLPPVSQGGRRSPHSSPRSGPHHAPRSPRASRGLRASGHARAGRAEPERQEAEPQQEGRGYSHLFPSLDPQKEQDLYRSFEAEFLANTQLSPGGSGRGSGDKDLATLQLHVTQQQQQQHQQAQGLAALQLHPPGDPNVTDSAYSSSSSSTSSITVGGKVGALPDLRKHPANPLPCPLEKVGVLENSRPLEGWGGRGGGRHGKLPALSGSLEDGELLTSLSNLRDVELEGVRGGRRAQDRDAQMDGREGRLDWAEGAGHPETEPGFLFGLSDDDPDDDLPPPELCPSPLPLPPSEDCSFQDSSSESSSMCVSLSEPRSGEPSPPPPPPPPPANGDAGGGGVVLRPKKGLKKPDRVPSIYKLKLRPRIRPRTDNRPENSPSRIPTPVSYKDQQLAGIAPAHTPPRSPQVSRANGHTHSRKAMHQALADLVEAPGRAPGLRDCSSSLESGSLDDEAWM